MADWKDRLFSAFEDEENSGKVNTVIKQSNYQKKVDFYNNIVKSAFKQISDQYSEIKKKYPEKVYLFFIEKNYENPCLIHGSKTNPEWKFCISYQENDKAIYVKYSFKYKNRNNPFEGYFDSQDIDLVKTSEIFDKLADLIYECKNPPSGAGLIDFG